MRQGRILLGALVAATALLGGPAVAQADGAPKAEVMVIHATKCAEKKVDPKIGEAPPAMGYDCLTLLDKKTMPLALNQASTTSLPNGRTFQLLHTEKAGNRYKVSAAINAPDGGFIPLATISADPNKAFNVGGFAYQGGALVLTIKIVP